MEPACYLNGVVLPLSEAKLSVLDLSVLRGFAIYEGLTSFNGKPFRFTDHWKRFERSADALGLKLPYPAEAVEEAMRAVIAHNAPGQRANLRMVLTGGEAHSGIEHVPGRESLFITAEPASPLPETLYTHGGSLITHEHQRFMPEIKTIHYIPAVLLQKQRSEAGAIEILYHDGDHVLECATSNVFLVKDGIIVTPVEDVLGGITRKVVLEVAHADYPIEERAVSLDELADADEVFITSSFKDIVPIVSIDGERAGSGKPGPVTKDLMGRFGEEARHA